MEENDRTEFYEQEPIRAGIFPHRARFGEKTKMPEGTSLIEVGDILKPATVLIEKISEAIGGYVKPYQIKRVAKAEAEAEIIKAQAQIEVTELQHRALVRFVAEEARKQDNIESITQKAIPLLEEASNPKNVEDDWLVNFFDKCRIVSDEEMQSLWAKVLAGEVNSPGTYSKRTVNFLGSLDKTDAQHFTSLCGFGWLIADVVPLIFDIKEPIYANQGINFEILSHLDDIGLVSFDNIRHFVRLGFPKRATIHYYGTPLNLEFSRETDNKLETGHVLLTKTGRQLALICGSSPVDGFQDYVIERWLDKELILSSPYPGPVMNSKLDAGQPVP